jgi:GNAT superfamily N-acetyltransferase
MNNKQFRVELVKSWPTQEIIQLYQAGGWWTDSADSTKIPQVIQGSLAFAIVVDMATNKAVGMGRLVSDGVSDAYIQDMVILPEFRGLGLGKQLVNTLIEFCTSKHILWLGLIAEPGYASFYEDVGFRPMKKYIPMLFNMEK